jgi:hypothetical protein
MKEFNEFNDLIVKTIASDSAKQIIRYLYFKKTIYQRFCALL